MKTLISVGPALFAFMSHDEWVNKACRWFRAAERQHEIPTREMICVDAHGNICRIGRDFAVAERAGAFPITVHAYRGDIPSLVVHEEKGASRVD